MTPPEAPAAPPPRGGVACGPAEPDPRRLLEETLAPEAPCSSGSAAPDADLERRFGGLRRLWGDAAYQRVRRGRVAVVGVGGVGSWAAEALARSGVAALTLVDLDHVAESNINRQVQALGHTVGAAKVQALAARLADIHPGCALHGVEDFAEPENWPAVLGPAVDVVIDACDAGAAKLAMAQWALRTGQPLVIAGAAGGKSRPECVGVDDLAAVTHDPLLAALRQRLRKAGLLPPAPPRGPAARSGLRCVFSREALTPPADAACAADGSLNCHGYGSVVTVTATFGMTAAAQALALLRAAPPQPPHAAPRAASHPARADIAM